MSFDSLIFIIVLTACMYCGTASILDAIIFEREWYKPEYGYNWSVVALLVVSVIAFCVLLLIEICFVMNGGKW